MRVLSDCDECMHFDVCKYTKTADEIIGVIDTAIDDACAPEPFDFAFTCQAFVLNGPTQKPARLFDTTKNF